MIYFALACIHIAVSEPNLFRFLYLEGYTGYPTDNFDAIIADDGKTYQGNRADLTSYACYGKKLLCCFHSTIFGCHLITYLEFVRFSRQHGWHGIGRSMPGYDVKNGKISINEDGVKIVRLIFHKFVNEGKGTLVIARELREAGIKPLRNVKEWRNTTILCVIHNEKYCGDLVQKKTYTLDFLSHEKKYNRVQRS